MNSSLQKLFLLIVLIVVGQFWTARCVAQEIGGSSTIDFAHDVLPVLKSKCAKCHTSGVYKGGLSLETRKQLLDSGTVEVGDHKSSDLYDRLVSDEEGYQMPPVDEGKSLTKDEVKKFADWINEGLAWPEGISLKKPVFKRPLALTKVQIPERNSQASNPIDAFVDQYFQENSIAHPGELSDRNFLRRAKLDLLGLLPIPQEASDFSSSANENKHDELVSKFLDRDREYADHWMSFWNDLLRNDYAGTGYIDGGRKQITTWLHQGLIKNKPYNVMVRELISPSTESEGFIKGIKWRGRVNASQIQPLQFSQNVSQVFLGINMKCASCHNSFIDDWKLEDAYGLAAISSESPLEMHRCDVPTGETATSSFVFPELGNIDHKQPREQRLAKLAELITLKENGRFSRTIVNRLWHRMTGRGLVHPVDVMANEAWSEPLLNFLAHDFVESGYDIKHALRLIATSRIYRSRVGPDPSSENSGGYVFQGVSTKRMTSEQFVDSVWSLTGAGPANPHANIGPPDLDSSFPLGGEWIWNEQPAHQAAPGASVYFRRKFSIDSIPERAIGIASCDNELELWINGQRVMESKEWHIPASANLKPYLKRGENLIVAKGSNIGSSPNPAGFYAMVVLGYGDENEQDVIVTDSDWETANQPVSRLGKAKTDDELTWNSATVIQGAWKIYGRISTPARKALSRQKNEPDAFVRASLVRADLLMRSLGRPNREQVVTTRPEALSTLQALDLSNGEILSGWLQIGAKNWLQRQKEFGWSNEQLVNRVYQRAYSRKPDQAELELLTISENENKQQSLEDLLWLIVMLPEFQLIH